ncbi:hypothetical protein NON20_00175 [Synechocystis sp. B12]|nr:hypothetical protein NON20_00175 [Synechocystis sp. B12]
MLKVLHLSDIHLGSGFSHGHINPATGLNTRLEDFIQSLRLCIDRAIAEPADVVLFGGMLSPMPLRPLCAGSLWRRISPFSRCRYSHSVIGGQP